MPSDPQLSPEMLDLQAAFQEVLASSSGFFYPYRFQDFSCNVWTPSDRTTTYIQAVTQLPDLVHRDVRFMVVAPGEVGPVVGAVLPFDGGQLTVRAYQTADPLSGEAIIICHWEA